MRSFFSSSPKKTFNNFIFIIFRHAQAPLKHWNNRKFKQIPLMHRKKGKCTKPAQTWKCKIIKRPVTTDGKKWNSQVCAKINDVNSQTQKNNPVRVNSVANRSIKVQVRRMHTKWNTRWMTDVEIAAKREEGKRIFFLFRRFLYIHFSCFVPTLSLFNDIVSVDSQWQWKNV